jgi:hypothetical protein
MVVTLKGILKKNLKFNGKIEKNDNDSKGKNNKKV